MDWRPLLGGDTAGPYWDCVREIADELAASAPTAHLDHSLAEGHAGLAVLYAYLTRAGAGRGYEELAFRYLDAAMAAMREVRMGASLYAGFPGVAWAAAHIQRLLPGARRAPGLSAVDRALVGYLSRSPWRRDYDLVSGLVGLGVYANERRPDPVADELLGLIVRRLAETAERTPEGTTWHTAPGMLPAEQRDLHPDGYYNLGLAHGVPGVIALLAGICPGGFDCGDARTLVDEAARWLLAQARPTTEDAAWRYSYWLAPGTVPQPARTAWCYGEPGIACALLSAGRALDQVEWEREALALARRAAARDLAEAEVADAGLCHGALGLAHIFNRLAQATGDRELREAALVWLAHALGLRQPGRDVAGFAAAEPAPDGSRRWRTDYGLLTGAAGVALGMLAAVTDLEPAWDRVLLLSARAP